MPNLTKKDSDLNRVARKKKIRDREPRFEIVFFPGDNGTDIFDDISDFGLPQSAADHLNGQLYARMMRELRNATASERAAALAASMPGAVHPAPSAPSTSDDAQVAAAIAASLGNEPPPFGGSQGNLGLSGDSALSAALAASLGSPAANSTTSDEPVAIQAAWLSAGLAAARAIRADGHDVDPPLGVPRRRCAPSSHTSSHTSLLTPG